MLISFFKKNPAVSMILVPVAAVAFWSFSFFQAPALNLKHAMPLYEVLGNLFINFKAGANILALALIIVEAFLLNHIVEKNEILGKSSYLPAFFYVLIMSCAPPFLTLHQIIPANLFLLLALNSLFNMFRKEHAFRNAFDTGFLLGIATLFYFPAIVLFLVVWFGFIILRPFIWREYVICFIGLMVPYIFAGVYYFVIDMFDYLWFDKMIFPITIRPFSFYYSSSFSVLLYTCAFLLLFSLVNYLNTISGKSIKTRGIFVILFWYMIIAFLSFAIAPESSVRYLSLAIIPFSVFISHYFLTLKRGWWGELLMFILLMTILYNNINNTFY